MKIRKLLLAPGLLLSTAAFAQSSAHANLMNAQGTKVGTANFSAVKGGTEITLDLAGLPPGVHAVHIHTVGKCEGPAFTTAGGHLNPDMKMHGKDNPQGAHAGDLMNFTVDANGRANTKVMAEHVTMTTNSLFHEGGTSLMIHEMPDDYKTDPTGNAGARIACGVIEK